MSEIQKSQIIELREEFSVGAVKDDHINGQFDMVIDTPITLEQGDSIQLKSAFLDSVASSSGKIEVKDFETTITLTCFLYVFNWTTNGKTYNKGEATREEQPDGKEYFLCDTVDTAPFMKKCLGISFNQSPSSGHDHWGDMALQFHYLDVAGNRVNYVFDVPKINGSDDSFSRNINEAGNPYHFGFLFDERTGIVMDTSRKTAIDKGSIYQVSFSSEPYDVDSNRTPHPFTKTFTIDAGNYDPDELARIITDNCSKLNIDDSGRMINYPMNSPFMTSPRQFNGNFPQPLGEVYLTSRDGDTFYEYNALTPTNDFLIGSSNVALEYDEGLSKFKWTILNNPIYAGANADISIQAIQQGNTGNYFIANKNSGIVFNNLEPHSLWFDKLGFDASITAQPVSKLNPLIGTTLQNQTMTSLILKEKVNMTGSYKGLDVAVIKNSFQKVPSFADINGASTVQNSIFASTSLQSLITKEGFYIIEIDMGIPQDIRGFKNSNRVQAIVSKYYSTNAFTSCYSEGSIPYIHRGIQPVILNKFQVRILNPDFENSKTLGDNNTLFLEVIKNIPEVVEK